MLTAYEVEGLLLEHTFEWRDDWGGAEWDDWSEQGTWKDRGIVEVVGLGTVKVWEHDFAGIETNVSHLMFQIGDRIFRKEGLWVSHDGQYWDGPFTEVKPVQKVITDYEPIKE